jgi:hypothetical protein
MIPGLPDFPKWQPARWCDAATRLHALLIAEAAPVEHHLALARLVSDARLKTVIATLWRRKRSEGYGQDENRPFEFRATDFVRDEARRRYRRHIELGILVELSDEFDELVQQEAWGILLDQVLFVVRFGCRVMTPAEAASFWDPIRNTAHSLRNSAEVLRQLDMVDEATQAELSADKVDVSVTMAPAVDDPFLVTRVRSDAAMRAMKLAVRDLLKRLFGQPMGAIADTIADVALNRPLP